MLALFGLAVCYFNHLETVWWILGAFALWAQVSINMVKIHKQEQKEVKAATDRMFKIIAGWEAQGIPVRRTHE